MITVKVQCGCGQKYAFDVEPVNGRMPSPIACPVCGADGTAAANQIIAQSLPPPPVAAPAVAVKMRMPVSSPPPEPSAAPPPQFAPGSRRGESESEGEQWKWWYFVLAGVCIGGYSIWQAYDQHRLKPLGELFFAVFCVAIGIWDFQHKRKKKKQRMQA